MPWPCSRPGRGFRSPALAAGPNPEAAASGLVDVVQAKFGDVALASGRVLRRRWMGRKIAFEVVPV